MVDEKVTVISSVVHMYIRTTYQAKLEVGNGISANFFVTEEAGNALLHLVISMKMTVIFSNKSGARLII